MDRECFQRQMFKYRALSYTSRFEKFFSEFEVILTVHRR